ncbi:Transthyretin-like family protein [Dictyocaulus viviparus]|uniref:Transthyretin-like family protein n=1 Tax=Dictyocaulus viviparus TaxID=29172 RepID=A0A0D8XR79_DICVI|nr:Transthyretin-like family protein [Dictyocaulus viviparus]
MMLYKIIWLCFFIDVVNAFGRTQSVAVEGVLMCDDQQARDVLVKLYEEDTLTPDELMDSSKTDNHGKFRLSGFAEEITEIDPKINIYHDCDDGIKVRYTVHYVKASIMNHHHRIIKPFSFQPCQRKLTIYIPSQYITNTKQPTKTFNLGILQLAAEYPDEERDCFHA